MTARYDREELTESGRSPALVALIERLLVVDPAQRPTAEEALRDPYFADRDAEPQSPPPEVGTPTPPSVEPDVTSPGD
jgi:serine/threonine protein kinase